MRGRPGPHSTCIPTLFLEVPSRFEQGPGTPPTQARLRQLSLLSPTCGIDQREAITSQSCNLTSLTSQTFLPIFGSINIAIQVRPVHNMPLPRGAVVTRNLLPSGHVHVPPQSARTPGAGRYTVLLSFALPEKVKRPTLRPVESAQLKLLPIAVACVG